MKFIGRAALGVLLLSPAALQAQTVPAQPGVPANPPAASATTPSPAATATPTAGATVYDSAGAVVGTIDQVTPQAVVVNVDNAKVSLPPASIGSGPQGLRIALTRAEVVAAASQAQAGAQQQLQAQLTPGASVRGSGGTVVGTVKSADAQYVTLTTGKGDVQLPMSGFGIGPNGPVIGMTAAQLDAAVTQAGGSASATGAATSDAEASSAGTTTTTTDQTSTTTRSRPRAR